MFWAVFILTLCVVAFGVAIYRIDKNVKSKYEKKFNPNEWQLPGYIELPVSVESTLKIPSPLHVQPHTSTASVKMTYEIKPSAYSGAQHAFYKAIQVALAGEYYLFTKVNAADVLNVAAGNVLATHAAVNNLTLKQFDFVVCDRATLTPVCVIDFGNRVDAQLKSACESAQLPLVSFNAQASYDSPLLRAKIVSALDVKDSSVGLSNESALDIVDEKPINNLQENGIDLVWCPACSAVMLKRKAKNGEHAGKLFWLCSTFPKCRGMQPIK
jgi:hypothetical protein